VTAQGVILFERPEGPWHKSSGFYPHVEAGELIRKFPR